MSQPDRDAVHLSPLIGGEQGTGHFTVHSGTGGNNGNRWTFPPLNDLFRAWEQVPRK